MEFNYRPALPFYLHLLVGVCGVCWCVCVYRNCIWQNWEHVRACIFNQVFI